MSWTTEGDYEDYLHELGWLEHKPRAGHPRPGHIGETVYAEEWAELMQKLERDGINAPNSMLAGILNDLPTRVTQRHALICASIMCWLGTACGQAIVLNGKRFRQQHTGHPYLVAWTLENQRRPGVNHGYRTIEHLLAPEDHFGRDPLMGGKTLMQIPVLSVDDFETIEHLMVWLGDHGDGFILRCERRIDKLTRFEWTKRNAEHQRKVEKLGLSGTKTND